MWELAEDPRAVKGRYCGFVVSALLRRDVDTLHFLLENIEIASQEIKYNGWIEASILKDVIERGLNVLEVDEDLT